MIDADAIVKEAMRWPGTPWCANSEACGIRGGVSCHNLPRAVLINSGHLPATFPKITGDPTHSRHSTQSIIEPWMNSRPEFRRLDPQLLFQTGGAIQTGDVFGLRIFRCIDHLGLVLDPIRFMHVLQGKNTAIDQVQAWLGRILEVWRLV